MARYIHNLSGGQKIYEGVPVNNQAVFQIPKTMEAKYAQNSTLITDVANRDCKISKDGSNPIDDVAQEILYLQGVDIEPRTSEGVQRISADIPEGDFDTVLTHNFCDNTTWSSTSDSTWTLQPSSGKKLILSKSECNYEPDLRVSGVTKLCIDYYIWINSTHQLAKTVEITHKRDIYAFGNEHFYNPPDDPDSGELPNGICTVKFNYREAKALVLYNTPVNYRKSKIVLRLEKHDAEADDHTPATGTYATVGFIVVEEDE